MERAPGLPNDTNSQSRTRTGSLGGPPLPDLSSASERRKERPARPEVPQLYLSPALITLSQSRLLDDKTKDRVRG